MVMSEHRTGRNIKALCVHVFGHPCKIIDLVAAAEQFRIKLIEDAAIPKALPVHLGLWNSGYNFLMAIKLLPQAVEALF